MYKDKNYMKNWRKQHKEKEKNYRKKYYQEHKKYYQDYMKDYRQTHKEEIEEQHRKNYEEHKKERKAHRKIYIQEHKKEMIEYRKIYYKTYREQELKRMKTYQKNHRKEISEKTNVYNKNRRKIDINFKLKCYLRNRLRKVIKGNSKSARTLELIGCSIEQLKEHLEKQFKQGMNWQNYGLWHIDHIRPCAKFDLSRADEQARCFHYTNLQPLWAKENLEKKDKILEIVK